MSETCHPQRTRVLLRNGTPLTLATPLENVQKFMLELPEDVREFLFCEFSQHRRVVLRAGAIDMAEEA